MLVRQQLQGRCIRPSGRKEPVSFGLYDMDMQGNVFEWVEDLYHDGYTGAPTDGSPWVKDGDAGQRVAAAVPWSARQGASAPPLASGSTPAAVSVTYLWYLLRWHIFGTVSFSGGPP